MLFGRRLVLVARASGVEYMFFGEGFFFGVMVSS